MFETCETCGAPVSPNAVFCVRCGGSVDANAPNLAPFDPARHIDSLDFSDAERDDADWVAPEIPDGPISAFRLGFTRKYADFRGRASRREFWFWTAAVVAINVAAFCATVVLSTLFFVEIGLAGLVAKRAPILWLGVDLLLTPPSLAVLTRRLRDRDVSARVFFVPTVVAAALWLGANRALSEGEASPILRALADYSPLVLLGIGIWLFVESVLPGKPSAKRFGPAPRRD